MWSFSLYDSYMVEAGIVKDVSEFNRVLDLIGRINPRGIKKRHKFGKPYNSRDIGIETLRQALGKKKYSKRCIVRALRVSITVRDGKEKVKNTIVINRSTEIYKAAYSILRGSEHAAQLLALSSKLTTVYTELAKLIAPTQTYNCINYTNDKLANDNYKKEYANKILEDINPI